MTQMLTVLVTDEDTHAAAGSGSHLLPSLSKNKPLRRQRTLSSAGTSGNKGEGNLYSPAKIHAGGFLTLLSLFLWPQLLTFVIKVYVLIT